VHLGLAVGDLGVVAARHDDHDVRARRGDLVPAALLGILPGKSEHVVAAGVVDQLRGPVAGDERGIQPFQGDHAGPAHDVARQHADPVNPGRGVLYEVHRLVLGVGGLGQRARVGENLADRVRVQRDHHREAVDLVRDLADVVIGDGAHRAQRLGDDQIGGQLAERLGVELIDRFTGERALLDRGIDLRRGEPVGQPITGDLRQITHRRGIVAFVGDADDIGPEAEGEEHLCGRWDETDDAHGAVCPQTARGRLN
jgi:hypothetical protein